MQCLSFCVWLAPVCSGEAELRQVIRDAKYKTVPCQDFFEVGICNYGLRYGCAFTGCIGVGHSIRACLQDTRSCTCGFVTPLIAGCFILADATAVSAADPRLFSCVSQFDFVLVHVNRCKVSWHDLPPYLVLRHFRNL